MDFVFYLLATLISLGFLGIVAMVAGVAIPGLFLAAAAPILDRIFPERRTRETSTAGRQKAGEGGPTTN